MSIINHDYVGEKTMSGKVLKRFAKECKKIFSERFLGTLLFGNARKTIDIDKANRLHLFASRLNRDYTKSRYYFIKITRYAEFQILNSLLFSIHKFSIYKFSGATEIIISSQKYIFEFKNMKKCFILLTIVRKIEIHLNQSLKNFLTTSNVLDTKIKMKIVEFFSTFQVSDVARDSKISKSRASKCLRELATNRLLEIRKGLLCKKAPNRLAGKVFEFIKLEERLIKDLEKEIREILKVKPFSIAIFSSSLYSLKLDSIDVLVIIKDYKNNVSKISSEPSEIFGIPISILLIDRENFKSNVKRSVFPLSMLTNHRKIYGKDFGENGMVKDEKERVMFELSKIGCWLKR